MDTEIRAIVFDFGNVVGYFDHRLTTNRLAAYAGISADQIHAYLFGSPLEADYDAGRISTPEFLKRVHEGCRLRCSEDDLRRAWADIFWPNDDVIALFPGLKQHYRLVLASNTNELHSRQFRRQFADAFRHFDALVLSHEVGVRKPHTAFYEHCRREADCAPHECLFIDDLIANVNGAQACGWHSLLFTGIGPLREQLVGLGVSGLADAQTCARQ